MRHASWPSTLCLWVTILLPWWFRCCRELQQAFAAIFPRHNTLCAVERPDGQALNPRTRKFTTKDVIIFREFRPPVLDKPRFWHRQGLGFETEYLTGLRQRRGSTRSITRHASASPRGKEAGGLLMVKPAPAGA